jgi:predicted cobalt transporter CbtA
MVRALVLRAAGIGALAGLVAFVFARIFAEPLIQAAIDYEGGRAEAEAALAAAAGQPPSVEEPELFSRAIQGNLGMGLGMIVFGVAIGLFFAVAFCMAYGRTGNVRPRQLSLLVGLFGFLAVFAIPFVKYPANPPAVGNPDTIRDRGALWVLVVVVSVVVLVLAVVLGQRLQARLGTWNATLVAGAAALVVVGIVMALLPALGELSPNVAESGSRLTETPQPLTDPSGKIVFPGFDPDLLYWFRLYSVGAQLLLWGVLALGFAPLADRVLRRHGNPSQRDLASAT